MPLIRKSAGKDLHFSVSPWNLKQPTSRADATQAYQETSLPFKPDQPLDPSAATDNRPDTKKNVRQHVSAGPWQARKKPALSDRTRQHRLIQNNTQESSQEQNSDTSENDELSSQTGSLGIVLQGTAVLAFLPTGQLSGLCALAQLCSIKRLSWMSHN